MWLGIGLKRLGFLTEPPFKAMITFLLFPLSRSANFKPGWTLARDKADAARVVLVRYSNPVILLALQPKVTGTRKAEQGAMNICVIGLQKLVTTVKFVLHLDISRNECASIRENLNSSSHLCFTALTT